MIPFLCLENSIKLCDHLSHWCSIVNLLRIYFHNICFVFWTAINPGPFTGTTFQEFSHFVEQNFSSGVSLATVLVVLFTTTNNTDLLNLPARQQNPLSGESAQVVSGWMKALVRALEDKLGDNMDRLFKKSEQKSKLDVNRVQNAIGVKLDSLSKLLKLYPYDTHGQFQQALKPVSEKDIEPAHVICPMSMQCQTVSCNQRSIRL